MGQRLTNQEPLIISEVTSLHTLMVSLRSVLGGPRKPQALSHQVSLRGKQEVTCVTSELSQVLLPVRPGGL